MRNTIATAALFVVLAGGAAANVLDECRQNRWPDVRMRACSEIIESPYAVPAEKAMAYNSLGEVRSEAGALGWAIADFTASIQLGFDNLSAYAGRGYAKFATGDFPGAIACGVPLGFGRPDTRTGKALARTRGELAHWQGIAAPKRLGRGYRAGPANPIIRL